MSEQNPMSPQGYQTPPVYMHDTEDEIDLRELLGILWAEKWLIICVTFLFAIGAFTFALLQPDIYRAESVLAPAETEQNMGGLASQFGGAAALLGVNLGSSSGGDSISTAIATMRSQQFIGRFIRENDLLVPLFAGTWQDGEAAIDSRIYESSSGTWLLEDGEPTAQEAYRHFSEIVSIGEPDRTTGIVTVAINWHNPVEAAEWVNRLVAAINTTIKTQEVTEATNAIAFLRGQLEQTQLVDMQRVFYQLIESQTRITMLADVREEYVFRVIDPATVPDQKVAPRRLVISIIGALAGGILALALVYFRRVLSVVKPDEAGLIK